MPQHGKDETEMIGVQAGHETAHIFERLAKCERLDQAGGRANAFLRPVRDAADPSTVIRSGRQVQKLHHRVRTRYRTAAMARGCQCSPHLLAAGYRSSSLSHTIYVGVREDRVPITSRVRTV
jgi:hypothetical protein